MCPRSRRRRYRESAGPQSWPRPHGDSVQIGAIDHQVEIADKSGAADRGRQR
jgi:hypothetical protein